MQIAKRFEQGIMKLDTPKHRMQLKKIEARWNRLQMYTDKEEQAIMMDLQNFLQQPEINNELQDMEHDISMEFRQMSMRYNKFVMDIDNKVAPELVAKLQEIGKKLEVLDYKFKKNLKFDPETKMWKVSMDNKVDAELQKDGAEIE